MAASDKEADSGTPAPSLSIATLVSQALPVPSVPLPADEGDVSQISTAVLARGVKALEEAFAKRSGVTLTGYAACESVDPATMKRALYAAAEASMQAQQHLYHQLIEYIKKRHNHTLEAIAVFEHCSFDESPLFMRVAFDGTPDPQKAKLYVVETSYAFLIKRIGDPVNADASTNPYLLIRGSFSPSIRAASRETARAIVQVLLSTVQPPQGVESLFRHCVRVTETDEHPSNTKAEHCLADVVRPSGWQYFHSYCCAHKCHKAAERVWASFPNLLSGVIHACKVLAEGNAMHHFREQLRRDIPDMIEISNDTVLPPEAVSYRRKMMQLFFPPLSSPCKHAKALLIAEQLLNSDWRIKGKLVHICAGAQCCLDKQDTIRKALAWLPSLFTSLRPGIFARNSWADWRRNLLFIALGEAMHGLGTSTFLKAFAGAEQDGPDEEAEAGALLTTWVTEQPHVPETQAPSGSGLDDSYESLRKEKAACLRKAVAMFESRDWFEQLWFMVSSLEPQKHLMTTLLHWTSEAWDLEQMTHKLASQPRLIRCMELLCQIPQEQMFRDCLAILASQDVCSHLPETERRRSVLLRTCMTSPAYIWQLISTRFASFPWRLLFLLGDRTLQCAEELLSRRACLRDSFAEEFFRRFPTPQELIGDESWFLLHTLAAMMMTTTYSTERAHSRNAKRNRARQSHKADVQYLALSHTAVAGLPFLRNEVAQQLLEKGPAKKKDAKDSRSLGTDSHVDVGEPAQKRSKHCLKETDKKRSGHSGGGGPWRAYVHINSAGRRFSGADSQTLSQSYKSLSVEEKQYYSELGRLGPLWGQQNATNNIVGRRNTKMLGPCGWCGGSLLGTWFQTE